jgi:DNA-binding SARP family transcriptional activator
MKKEFILYEQALELKELGFDETCMFPYFYANTNYIDSTYIDLANHNATEKLVSAVLYQQAFRWFREKYNLDSYILCTYIGVTSQKNNEYSFAIQHCDDYDYFVDADRYTYEEAELACLKKLIEITKNK